MPLTEYERHLRVQDQLELENAEYERYLRIPAQLELQKAEPLENDTNETPSSALCGAREALFGDLQSGELAR